MSKKTKTKRVLSCYARVRHLKVINKFIKKLKIRKVQAHILRISRAFHGKWEEITKVEIPTAIYGS